MSSSVDESTASLAIINCETDILIIDGMSRTLSNIYEIQRASCEWKNARLNRKLIFVNSLQITSLKLEDGIFKRHFVPSWKLQDYEVAFRDGLFCESHHELLLEDSELADRILSKFFLSGGSARWMLSFTPSQVIEDVKINVNKGWNIEDLVAGLTGTRANLTVNHLLQSIDKEEHTFFVSEYVTRILTEKCEFQFIKLASNCSLATNTSFDGWIMDR